MARNILRGALLGICYLLAVLIGMTMDGAAEGASIFWPAAGVAVAGLMLFGRDLWPGVFGAVFLGELAASGVDAEIAAFAFAEAFGVTVQAWVIATVLRYLAGNPPRLESIARILALLAIVIPLGSMISASIGTMALTGLPFSGEPPRSVDWLGWWLGDTLGAAIVLPLAMLMPGLPGAAAIWRGQPLTRLSRQSFALVLATVTVSLAGYVGIGRLQSQSDEQARQLLAHAETGAIHDQLIHIEHLLESGAWLASSGQGDTASAWEDFYRAQELPPELLSVGYVPAADGKAAGHLAVQPHRGERGAPVDLYSVPGNAALLRRAAERRSGLLAFTAPPEGSEAFGPLAVWVLPDFAEGMTDPREPRGWMYGVAALREMAMPLRLELARIVPLDDADGTVHSIDLAAAPGTPREASPMESVEIGMFGDRFILFWRTGNVPGASGRSLAALSTMFFGLSFAGMLAIFLLSLTQREARVRAEVRERTEELDHRTREVRSILDSSTAMIAVTTGDRRIVKANRACAEFFELTHDQLLGRQICQLLDGREVVSGPNGDADSPGGVKASKTVRLPDFKGREIYLDIQIDSWQTADGQERKTYFLTDVTQREKATRLLRRTEERFAIATDGAGIGVFDIDIASGNSEVSQSWKVMMGFEPDAKIDAQAEWTGRVHVDDLPEILENDAKCLRGQAESSVSEFRVTRADGVERWMRSHAVPVDFSDDGHALRLVGAQIDITDLRRSREELKARESILRRAIEGAGVGVALVDTEGRLTKVNKALCDFAQCSEEQIIELGFLKFVHPDHRAESMEMIHRLLQGADHQFQRETCFVMRDGSQLWGLMSVALIRDEDGAPLNFIVQVADISERKEMERFKDEFVSTVSHELRTPLTSINGSIGLIRGTMAEAVPAAMTRLLDLAQTNCDRLILLVNDLLDVEKIKAGMLAMDLAEANIIALASDAVQQNRACFEDRSVRCEILAPDGALVSQVDANRFQQIMSNLLSNAAKYSPEGGRVEVSLRSRGDRVRVSVTDNGPGLPLSFRSRVFQPFSQADGSVTRVKGGTGLGLYISRQLVERMAGTMGFESEPDVATTFWFEFPLVRAERRSAA